MRSKRSEVWWFVVGGLLARRYLGYRSQGTLCVVGLGVGVVTEVDIWGVGVG